MHILFICELSLNVGLNILVIQFHCFVFCRSWKKQLTIAKDARRVDILCYRISLAQRLLNGTKQFKEPHDIVLQAARKLEEEVGPINGVSSKMARGIVSRLSTGLEVQKLCALAIEKAEAFVSMVSSPGKDLPLRGETTILVSVCTVYEKHFQVLINLVI